jgi:DNA-directed RNA polymerase subunit RPC12/RpoP
MGAPGYTVFCRNGHIAQVVMHHEVSKYNVRRCRYCGSTEFTAPQLEWDSNSFESEVPREPLGYTYIGEDRVYIFDVSMVTKWERRTPDVIRRCINCKEEFTLYGGEIDFFKKEGLHLPRRCPKCREQRRNERKKEYVEERESVLTA